MPFVENVTAIMESRLSWRVDMQVLCQGESDRVNLIVGRCSYFAVYAIWFFFSPREMRFLPACGRVCALLVELWI